MGAGSRGRRRELIGPAAQGIVRGRFDFFVGDETGLLGAVSRLEALDTKARSVALNEVDGPEDRLQIATTGSSALRDKEPSSA